MLPDLLPGRSYFASALGSVREGDLVVFRNPKDSSRIFVKKVAKKETGGYFVEGLCVDSSSSRDFGIVPKNLVFGKIIS
ncbi:MAG: S26 family signal peptidase [Parcubacteria group bacterium]|nr:S26 family signal peptidase [Parcubacteria group bacterium]